MSSNSSSSGQSKTPSTLAKHFASSKLSFLRLVTATPFYQKGAVHELQCLWERTGHIERPLYPDYLRKGAGFLYSKRTK
jgi:hypothetical protein